MSRQREELDSALEALQNEMRQIISKLSPKEMVWIHQPVVGVVPVCVSPPSREPIGTIVGWYSGYPMIKLFSDGWIPAVGTVLYTSPAIEPKQKPVAWMLMNDTHCHIMATEWKPEDSDEYKTVPLYTAPSTREPLTDEQINSLGDKIANERLVGPVMDFRVRFARAIEQAHGITQPTEENT